MSISLLFQKLYNWIKYKTLPPSTLFKNRLFIERDSKHKRIFNNFGLVFRNSKWTNYESYNIKTEFRLSFYKYILLFLFFTVFFTVTIYFKHYYMSNPVLNLVSFLFWVCYDCLDYYFSFLIWVFTISTTIILKVLYSYFFFNNFSDNSKLKQFFTNNFFSEISILPSKLEFSFALSKHDANWVTYSWINSSLYGNNKELVDIFKRSLSNKNWELSFNFFKKLYRLTYLLSLTDDNNTINFYTKSAHQFFNTKNEANLPEKISFKYLSVYVYYLCKANKTYFYKQASLKLKSNNFKQKYGYNVSILESQSTSSSFLNKVKSGFFFINDLSFEKLSFLSTNENSLFFFNSELKNQIKTAKWNRWIYKYSILHRKIIKNSHKITVSKRIVNSGFYDNNLFDKNLWASVNCLKYKASSGSINSILNSQYPFFFNNSANWLNHNISTKKNSERLELIKFYENSFFWTLKRFFIFNSSLNNSIKSKKIQNLQIIKNLDATNTNSHINLVNLLQFSKIKNVQFFFNYNSATALNSNIRTAVDKSYFLTKDLNLIFEDLDILKKENLDVLYWTSLQSFDKKKSFHFPYVYNNTSGVFPSSSFKSNETIFISNATRVESDFYIKDFFLYLFHNNK